MDQEATFLCPTHFDLGILQGTSAVLVTFDMSEVRKIVECCRAVLRMLEGVDEIQSFQELANFVKVIFIMCYSNL